MVSKNVADLLVPCWALYIVNWEYWPMSSSKKLICVLYLLYLLGLELFEYNGHMYKWWDFTLSSKYTQYPFIYNLHTYFSLLHNVQKKGDSLIAMQRVKQNYLPQEESVWCQNFYTAHKTGLYNGSQITSFGVILNISDFVNHFNFALLWPNINKQISETILFEGIVQII